MSEEVVPVMVTGILMKKSSLATLVLVATLKLTDAVRGRIVDAEGASGIVDH